MMDDPTNPGKFEDGSVARRPATSLLLQQALEFRARIVRRHRRPLPARDIVAIPRRWRDAIVVDCHISAWRWVNSRG